MSDYRTPEEWQATHDDDTRIQAVLDQAVADGVSLMMAMHLDEPKEVVDHWVDALWDGLRDNLLDDRPEDGSGLRRDDRLRAIILLLHDRISRDARAGLEALNEVGS